MNQVFNIDVRDAIKRAGLYGYEAAAAVGMSESAFSRKIARSELTDTEKQRVFAAIESELKKRGGGVNHGESGTVAET